jgi:hypothetical protein
MIDITTGELVERGQVIKTVQNEKVIITHVASPEKICIQPPSGGGYWEVNPSFVNVRINQV